MTYKKITSSRKGKIAIAGLSHGHVTWILKKLKRSDLEVVGFYEPDLDLAKRLASQFGFPLTQVYSDLVVMLDTVRPEAVAAFGSIFAHLQVVEACAPRKIHVMVEKPLAVNMEHASRMAALASGHGIQLITNYETTWYASTYAAYRSAVEEKALGPIRKVVVHDGHRGPVEIGCSADFLSWLTDPVLNGGGAVVDFGCYGANLITWLMGGQEPISVTGILQSLKPEIYPIVDDEATIVLTYPKAQGIIQGSWNWPIDRKDMEIYGQTGYFVSVNELTIRTRNINDPEEKVTRLTPAPECVRDPLSYLATVLRGEEIITPGSLWSLENNLTVVRILDAAREPARTGMTVYLS